MQRFVFNFFFIIRYAYSVSTKTFPRTDGRYTYTSGRCRNRKKFWPLLRHKLLVFHFSYFLGSRSVINTIIKAESSFSLNGNYYVEVGCIESTGAGERIVNFQCISDSTNWQNSYSQFTWEFLIEAENRVLHSSMKFSNTWMD